MYEETIDCRDKEVHFLGLNKYACILKDSTGYKGNEPLDITSGSVRNLTLIQDCENPLITGKENLDYFSYCLHIDNPKQVGKKVVVEDCIMKCKYNACIGMGVYENNTIEIKNCELHTYDVSPKIDYKSFGVLMFHTGVVNNTSQGMKLIVDNCKIISATDKTIVGGGAYEGQLFECEFINNTIYSEKKGFTNESVHGKFDSEKYILSPLSHGNTITVLNSF